MKINCLWRTTKHPKPDIKLLENAAVKAAELAGLDMSFEWITSVIWLDADLLETEGLQCIAAEEGPALFILRYGDTIVEETD